MENNSIPISIESLVTIVSTLRDYLTLSEEQELAVIEHIKEGDSTKAILLLVTLCLHESLQNTFYMEIINQLK